MKERDRRDTTSVFPDIWALYQSCRKRNIPAKLVLETTENGEEICTFSWKGPSQAAAALKPANPPPPPAELSRRKSPSKLKKDRVKWRAWLERKLNETREENPSPPENLSTTPGKDARSAPVNVCEVELSAGTGVPSTAVSQYDIQGDHEQLSTNEPSSQPREEDVLPMRNEEDNDADARAALLTILQVPDDPKPNPIITTAEGATLTRLQPAVISQKAFANEPRKYHIVCLGCNHTDTLHTNNRNIRCQRCDLGENVAMSFHGNYISIVCNCTSTQIKCPKCHDHQFKYHVMRPL